MVHNGTGKPLESNGSDVDDNQQRPRHKKKPHRYEHRQRSNQFKKTRICQFGDECQRYPGCNYAHSLSELKKPISLNKTKMCSDYLNSDSCTKGSACSFAHGYHELCSTFSFFKMKICPKFLSMQCHAGLFCRHAHGQDEIKLAREWFENGMLSTNGGSVKHKDFAMLYEKYLLSRHQKSGTVKANDVPADLHSYSSLQHRPPVQNTIGTRSAESMEFEGSENFREHPAFPSAFSWQQLKSFRYHDNSGFDSKKYPSILSRGSSFGDEQPQQQDYFYSYNSMPDVYYQDFHHPHGMFSDIPLPDQHHHGSTTSINPQMNMIPSIPGSLESRNLAKSRTGGETSLTEHF